MADTISTDTDLRQRARDLYERLRPEVETPENIGKLIVMDVESGDYEIDELGIEASRRLQARHPEATLYALRIGYKTVESFGGVLEHFREALDKPLLDYEELSKRVSGSSMQ